jgi:uncharacterized protein
MNDLPEQSSPLEPENHATPAQSEAHDLPPEQGAAGSTESLPDTGHQPVSDTPAGAAPQLFMHYLQPEPWHEERIPNFGHLGILILIALIGLFGAGIVARVALYFHLFGVSTITQATTEIHYTLGSEGIFYILTFAGCLLIFPLFWHKGLLAGLHWRGATALRLRGWLFGAAVVCFILAMFNSVLIPGPADAPIDRIFRMPGAAWMLFAFGVTLAPFFEEMGFRGFLLPALCTAFDWMAEKARDQPAHPLDENGHPQWSLPAMSIAALITSVLFALIHADQTAYSVGPFLLLVCVSLVLCWVRLATRSLAASVLVHASYNFLLFSLMFFGTSGFRHLERM